MPNIYQLYENVREMDVVDIAKIVIMGSHERIVALQKEQLKHGKDATGDDIAPSYKSGVYADYKQSMNSLPEWGTPDLCLEGNFYRGIYFNDDMMNLTSDDPKTPSLKEKYGEGILGLNTEYLKKYGPYFKEKYKEEFNAQLIGKY